jgi:DNA topoisomerase-3
VIVCIAEKPSVAKDIAKVLGATTPHDGYMEGNGYQVTWTFGHLCTLKEPDDYTPEWKTWSLSRLPMIPARFGIKLIPNKTYAHQFHIIETLMQAAESIINCGDAGQEGELIQRWVMQKAKATCPVQRLWISSLTEESIRSGFNTLHPQSDYTSLYQAGLCRAIGDWLLGMNATRLYTLKYRPAKGQVLSIGRVQTPTLALIVNRQHEIDTFTPEQYWVLSTLYRNTLFTLKNAAEDVEEEAVANEDTDDVGAGKKNAVKGRITSLEEGQKALDTIKGKDFEVTGIGKKQGNEAPPRLFDLTSLQVECNKKYSFSADETLKYIQSLYEKKLTTYPRVDTTYLSDDIYPKCPQILGGLVPYVEYTKVLLEAKLPKSKRVFDSSKVTDHHAIIPTGVNPAGVGISREEKLVFDMVARRFIAAFYPDCKFSTTTVSGKVEKLEFRATGKQILEPGWHLVFDKKNTTGSPAMDNVEATENDSDDKDGENVLPNFVKGEKGPHEPTLTEKWTTPPKPYTEATLLRAMETAGRFVDSDELRDALKENGIGRPSTRAAIIETLFKRGYITKQRKSLIATPTGVDLIGVIYEELLKSAELTGQWEKKLREIEAHKYDATQFVEELKQMVIQLVQQVMADNSNRRVAATPVSAVDKGKQHPSRAAGGASRPAKKVTTPVADADVTGNKKVKKSTGGRTKKTIGKAAKNISTDKSNTETAANISPTLVKEGDTCPLCGKGHIIRGHSAFGCSEWKNGCKFRQPFNE